MSAEHALVYGHQAVRTRPAVADAPGITATAPEIGWRLFVSELLILRNETCTNGILINETSYLNSLSPAPAQFAQGLELVQDVGSGAKHGRYPNAVSWTLCVERLNRGTEARRIIPHHRVTGPFHLHHPTVGMDLYHRFPVSAANTSLWAPRTIGWGGRFCENSSTGESFPQAGEVLEDHRLTSRPAPACPAAGKPPRRGFRARSFSERGDAPRGHAQCRGARCREASWRRWIGLESAGHPWSALATPRSCAGWTSSDHFAKGLSQRRLAASLYFSPSRKHVRVAVVY